MRKQAEVLEEAIQVVPSERQMAWQDLEFTSFIHFGMNTFTGSEWGTGNENPELFQPKSLDCRQWVKVCKAAGMRGMILTAKHHDGFCLWPSAFTSHSVASSSWRGGQGDVVREAAAACREFGLKFGIYLSPWDRYELTYGQGEAYNTFYKNQLRELLTNYGELFCVWFDGACGEGKNGRKQEYDWQGYYDLIRELQPNAVISVCGPDVRWCGNEAGVCRASEWSVVPSYYSQLEQERMKAAGGQLPREINFTQMDLGSRKAIRGAEQLIWYPAEVDVSIRKGWFYHEEEDHTVKPLMKLLDYYYHSVGANASLLLNVPPNPEGLISRRDIEALLSLGAQLQIDFRENLAEDSTVTDSCRLDDLHSGQMTLDPNPDCYWHSGPFGKAAELILDLGDDYDINKIVLKEHIRTGQQIEKFAIYGEVEVKGKPQWKLLGKGTVLGHKRICRFTELRLQRIKVVVEQTRGFATLSAIEAY
ncbi:MAG: alpha-L-fucosidase [Oscillospiraceae bacterium]|nr:alpha-L-fucosidase [Oscillospiraceae bacterium]